MKSRTAKTAAEEVEISVDAVVKKYSESLAGQTVLIALSGGADSVSLLYECAKCAERLGYSLRCVHVNHRLRPAEEVERDAYIARQHCKRLKIPLTIVNIAPGAIEEYAKKNKVGIEAAARFFRHRIFRKQMARWSARWLFLGHTQDDMLELALMRFLQGSGPAGLASLPEKRGRILRPLINTSRRKIEAYLKARNIEYVTDSTNSDTKYLRNRIRHIVMPVLDREFPFWRSGVQHGGNTQGLVAAFLRDRALQKINWEPYASGSVRGYRTMASHFWNQSIPVREESMFQVIDTIRKSEHRLALPRLEPDAQVSRVVPSVRRRAIRQFATAHVDNLEISDCRFINTPEWIVIQEKTSFFSDSGFSILLTAPGIHIVENYEIVIRAPQSLEAYEHEQTSALVGLPCVFRSPQEGDSLLYKGHHRKLSELRTMVGKTSWRNHWVVEDALGIAVYMLKDIHSELSYFWRHQRLLAATGAVDRNASYMLEIKLRGNHA
ncbi:tRNA lysidine(34) synthetase TilS [Gracilinema caldarium]|uniref:tRNA lysidine(34) synthetase TilS n=1 Tax=Gracilinema caldarium TaxID=215591 RepID=UPI0026F117D0|nr:tRNA lysidine(34) synthetase TilS [Gracilinema caldarium]